jgi:RNA polymerase sigma-70 factor, ECF subfamily
VSTRGGDPAWRDQATGRSGPAGSVSSVGSDEGGPDDLLRRVARGDERAFTVLYEALAPRVFGLARRVLRDPAQAEEVAQEALVEVWRTAARFDPAKGSATAWVLTITHRRAVDRVRSAQAGADRERRVVAASGETPYDDVVEEVTANLEQQQVRRCLKGLTDLQREAITLAYYDGFTYREVAQKLDTALPTIKTRMRDGLIRLRDCLGVEVGMPATTRAGR